MLFLTINLLAINIYKILIKSIKKYKKIFSALTLLLLALIIQNNRSIIFDYIIFKKENNITSENYYASRYKNFWFFRVKRYSP